MPDPMDKQKRANRAVIEVDDRTAPAAGELVARAVAVIGGACLVVGGVLGYALGFLDGANQKKGGGDRAV